MPWHAHSVSQRQSASTSTTSLRSLSPARRRPTHERSVTVRPSIQRLLDAMDGTVAAFVCSPSMDIVARNGLGAALFCHWRVLEGRQANQARFVFLDPLAPELFADWERSPDGIVAILRSLAGRDPHDTSLAAIIGELSMKSDAFRAMWARHDVGNRYSGIKRFRHPLVGELVLDVDVIPLPADPGLTLIAHSAEAGTPSAAALRLLASASADTAVRTAAPATSDPGPR